MIDEQRLFRLTKNGTRYALAVAGSEHESLENEQVECSTQDDKYFKRNRVVRRGLRIKSNQRVVGDFRRVFLRYPRNALRGCLQLFQLGVIPADIDQAPTQET